MPSASTNDPGTGGSDGGLTEIERRDQRQLTVGDVDHALPSPADAPPGFRTDEEPDLDSTLVATEPAGCGWVYMQTPETGTFRDQQFAAGGSSSYRRDEAKGGGVLTLHLASYRKPYPTAFLDRAGAAMGTCGTHQRVVGGEPVARTASLIQMPNLGDQTFAVRITDEKGGTEDRLVVVSGHNRILVTLHGTAEPYDSAPLAELIETVLERLDD